MSLRALEPNELEWSLKTLRYELWMMRGLRDYMETHNQPSGVDALMHNAVLESFLLHVRNVYEFMFGKRVYVTDVRAANYFADCTQWDPIPSAYLKAEIERINKYLAHVTTRRDNPLEVIGNAILQIRWDSSKLCDELEGVAQRFFLALESQP